MSKMRTLRVIVALGLILGSGGTPAWAQLAEVDPALHSAVEAMISADPVFKDDPELATVCREIAEQTVVDPIERAQVTKEALELKPEDFAAIPVEVKEACKLEFAKVQEALGEKLETLRATDPGAAKELELLMEHGEGAIGAFGSGERYIPSTEVVEVAKGMFEGWKEDAIARGASETELRMAELSFGDWSRGEPTFGRPEMIGPPVEGGEGQMPTTQDIQKMVADGLMPEGEAKVVLENLEKLQGAGTEAERQAIFKEMAEQQGFDPREFGHEMRGPAEMMGREGFTPEMTERYSPEMMGREMPEGSFREMENFREMETNIREAISREIETAVREVEAREIEQVTREFETLYREPVQNQNYDNIQQNNYTPPSGETLVRSEIVGDHTEYVYRDNATLQEHSHLTPHP